MTLQQMLLGAGAGATKTYVEDLFKTQLYIGTGSALSINNGIDMTEGGMTWIKRRNGSSDHVINDTVRGAGEALFSNNSNAEETGRTDFLSAFNSNGFSIGTDNYVNNSTSPYASYSWRKAPKFFDVVTWTGNGTDGRNISHGLESVPGCIMVKRTSNTEDWAIYHRALGNTKGLTLNNTSDGGTKTWWDETTPTSTTFRIDNAARVNTSGETYVAYVFGHEETAFGESENAAIISCGNFTGNGLSGDTTGPVVNLGWEPQFVLIKRADTSESWTLYDSMRGIANDGVNDIQFKPDIQNGDIDPGVDRIDLTSTGFRVRSTDGDINASGGNYVYICIRRPDGYCGKPATVGTDVFNVVAGNSSSTIPNFASNFPVDMGIYKEPASTYSWYISTRLMGGYYLKADQNDAKSTNQDADLTWDANAGWSKFGYNTDKTAWLWKRHAGFDLIEFKGNGATRTLTHQLGRAPEMVWVKAISGTSSNQNWIVGHKGLNNGTDPWDYVLNLNSNDAESNSVHYWNDTAPTSTVVSLGAADESNNTGMHHMMMLFASVDGICKCDKYVGDGGTSNAVDCGFQPRFLITKKTNSTSHWKVYDSTRGNSRLRLDTNDAQANDVLVSFTSTGFTLISGDGTMNGNNEKYIYYAHA